MSEEQTMAFRQAAETDANLREKIKSATQLKAVWVHDGDVDTQKEADAVVAIAKEAGFTITVEEALHFFWKIMGLLNSSISFRALKSKSDTLQYLVCLMIL